MKPVIYTREEHTVSRRDIDPDALRIIERLSRSGHRAHLVGGGVRDLLLGKIPKDFDIASDATPRRIKSLFSNSRIIGRRFKLIHIYFLNQKIIEVATFRDLSEQVEEGEDGSLLITNDNKFGTEETDALRRDITINALFYDATTRSIIDYVGGMEDLRAGIVRVIGDPDVRFAEDPVRLVRVVRHAVRSGFRVEDGCYESLIRNSRRILDCSQVRVYEELKKDLSSGYALDILRLLHEVKILQLLVPEITSEMLAPGSNFSETMSHIDGWNRAGDGYSITATLATIALFAKDGGSDAPVREIFSSREELSEYLGGVFSHFSVPKKERERVEESLLLWYDLVTEGVEGTFEMEPMRLPYLPDVLALLKALPITKDDRAVFKLISHLMDSTPAERPKRRRGRRRAPRPNGPRNSAIIEVGDE